MTLYIQNSILRESCYNCKYKGRNNIADIILGDFWGVSEVHSEFFDEHGVSAIIVNSEKGKEFLEKNKIFENVEYIESNIEYIEKYNSAYCKSPKKPYRRHTIKYDIEKNTLSLISEAERYKKLFEDKPANNIDSQMIALENEIKFIKNSKRWQITDKFFNIINKLLRRG